LPELVPVRYGRMVASPFTFFRGSATVMARDLAATPVTGLTVQACGDAYLSNFDAYAPPERNLVFDVNDFDETLPGTWEWDVKRLVASVVVAARTNGFRAADCDAAARATVRSYRKRMASYASMSHLAVWYTRIRSAKVAVGPPGSAQRDFGRGSKRATQRGHLEVFAKMTTTVDGNIRIADDPPLIVHASDEVVGDHLRTLDETYRSSIRDDLNALLQRYTFVDFALKVVGVGSVGTRCNVVLMRGNDDNDPLFLQIKEGSASVLEPYADKSQYRNHGKRIVRGQQYTQATSDIFLGWGPRQGDRLLCPTIPGY
jgi:uncharacterized protein (DUF2252 family)